jgi:hypothetical protein
MKEHSFYGYGYGIKIKKSILNRLDVSQPVEEVVELRVNNEDKEIVVNIPKEHFERIIYGFMKTLKK